MNSLLKLLAFFVATARGIANVVRLAGRWKGSDLRPNIVLERVRPASWGVCEIGVSVRNAGNTTAKNCRYCRYQSFSMLRAGSSPKTLTVREWYASNAFALYPEKPPSEIVAHVTRDVWPQSILKDVMQRATTSDVGAHATVCQDRFGTKFRFWTLSNGESGVDTWRDSPLDRWLHRTAPEWTRWVVETSPVNESEWTYAFS